MGLLDDAKNLAEGHLDQVKEGLQKAEQLISEKTGGKFDSQLQQGEQLIEGQLGGGAAPAAGTPAEAPADPGATPPAN